MRKNLQKLTKMRAFLPKNYKNVRFLSKNLSRFYFNILLRWATWASLLLGGAIRIS